VGERPGDDGQPVDGVVVFHPAPPGRTCQHRQRAPTAFRRCRTAGAARFGPPTAYGRLTARWALSYAGHVTVFHTLRVPVYWGAAARAGPGGCAAPGPGLVARGPWTPRVRPVRRPWRCGGPHPATAVEDASTYVRLEEAARSLVRGSQCSSPRTGAFGALVAAWTLLPPSTPSPWSRCC
jgi:hypothetical protein